ncbi:MULTISPECIES: adenosylcobinamide-phosphate synthase CbiB [unclassified Pseudobutyrivibrio]|uniref:adenosylcobinamide-phosphate synthase CbiB n=1 Tax=unclassified Pseudobutyrivibrio TaxID=2638619 RepID=UPI0005D27EBA|nr:MULTISPECIES: adenosylcobinamide-phosphate synthase CbiB [unclassified Pseudobutyrivibrio]SFO41563.1 adenosylcobinamide-phosphate synthase [Pseudobutyrivibrio sp. JW11]
MIYHMTAFIVGFVLDLLIGDPYCLPHPVRWIGKLIDYLTNKLLKQEYTSKKKNRNGLILVILVILATVLISAAILVVSYTINSYFGIIIESVMSYQCLASKSLYTESMKVYHALKERGLEAGREAVSMIVGRDTASLDETGVTKAAVETVAENTSDGVIAPMVYLAIGGPVLGMAYKAINTMDSMIGYKNDRFYDFGKYAAKLDDIVNYIPARISALLMILSCLFLGPGYSMSNAFRIFKRDRYNHASPNSAQTESACAGALGIKLAGPASYFGKIVEKPFIGDGLRAVELEDIKRANKLMLATSVVCELLCVVILVLLL